MIRRILAIAGSLVTIGFGVWHFFVPQIWHWYSYIDPQAPELTIAVRAINVFFSLCLVLFGVVNILFILGTRSNRYSIIVMLSATSVLWMTRTAFQLIYPQGSQNPAIHYGMLSAFILVTLSFLISLATVIFRNDAS